jgi:hypothetical protein
MNNMKKLLSAMAVAAALVAPLKTHAVSVNLGAAGDFTILALEGGTLSINSATSIIGDVGVGKNVTTSQYQKVDNEDGNILVHSTALASFNANFNTANVVFTTGHGIQTGAAVDTKLQDANTDALNAAATYAALIPAVSSANDLGSPNDISISVTGGGGQNVYRLGDANFNSDTLTINGGSSDTFIFDVTGNFDFSQSQIVLNGVTPDQVLFNFLTGSSGHVDVNKDTTVFNGTILAPDAPIIYHNPATFTGRIIGSDITLHSDFNITGPGGEVPDAGSTLALMGIGLGLLAAAKRKFLA